jgi:hypothetical protein
MEIAKGRAKKVNAAQEATTRRTMPAIAKSLQSLGETKGHSGKKLACLKQQFTARIGIGCKHDNKNKIGMGHRSLSKPYQLVMEKKPPRFVDGKPQPQAACPQELLKLMPDVDREEGSEAGRAWCSPKRIRSEAFRLLPLNAQTPLS